MKLSLNWLSDFIDLEVTDPSEIERRITAGIAEVDEVEVQGALLGNCCVGKVMKVGKHPNADRLLFCEVKTDRGIKHVVCGGTNVREGMRVAFAHTGATVRWHGTEMMKLEKTKIRGVESEGMICAAEELDLQKIFPEATDRLIIDLGDGDEGVGTSLRDHLGLHDVILHIDNHAITHRPDLFSHIGFAREFVALGLAKWNNKLKTKNQKPKTFPKKSLPFKLINDIDDLIPRYCSCLIDIEGIGTTPDWMKRRLEATGWRSINLPIDITNYVATETGMPLHSFDADDIKKEFHMRTAKQGESLVTLDDVKRDLPAGAVVISDEKGIFDLLGIMGGLRSSTKPTTKRIYLHAAIVDPVSIRRAVIATGHRTDAATVYEKGIPKITAKAGFDRALQLFLDLVPGARIASSLQEWGDDGKPKPITLPLNRVQSMLGIEVPEKKIVKILEDLECTVKSGTKNQKLKTKNLSVTPPFHRNDIKGTHDLIEEISRIAGYNKIPESMPTMSMHLSSKPRRIHQLRDALKDQRYCEILPISLVGASLLKKADLDASRAAEIMSPLGEETSLLQTSTFPSLLEHAQRNILATDTLRTFHWGHVFEKGTGEKAELSMLLTHTRATPESSSLKTDPFLLIKRDLETILRTLHLTLDIDQAGSPPPYAHPGRFAQLTVRGEDNGGQRPSLPIGMLFEVHPAVRQRFDLPHRTAVAVLDLSAIVQTKPKAKVITGLPQFPSITYDITVTLSMQQQASSVVQELRGTHDWLESVDVADLYSGKPLEAGHYNLTLRLTYRAPDRTLKEEEVKPVHEKIISAL